VQRNLAAVMVQYFEIRSLVTNFEHVSSSQSKLSFLPASVVAGWPRSA
jgi:hypothetical protein